MPNSVLKHHPSTANQMTRSTPGSKQTKQTVHSKSPGKRQKRPQVMTARARLWDCLKRPADLSPPPIDIPRLGISFATPKLSDNSSSPATAGSPKASLFPDPSPSTKLRAATVRIPISFVRAPALAFMTCLTPLHPRSIVYSGIIEPEACSAHAANSSLNVSPIDDALATELHTLRHLLSDIYDPLTSATRQWSHVHPIVRPFPSSYKPCNITDLFAGYFIGCPTTLTVMIEQPPLMCRISHSFLLSSRSIQLISWTIARDVCCI